MYDMVLMMGACNNVAGAAAHQTQDVPRSRWTVQFEERILENVARTPDKSTRGLAAEYETDNSTVHRVLRSNDLRPYHIQKVQAFHGPDGATRRMFCTWVLQQTEADPLIVFNILFTDESNFDRDGVFNCHNIHHWAEENPHDIRKSRNQVRWSLNVWGGMIDDELIGFCVLPARLDGETYRQFLEDRIPDLLKVRPLERRAVMLFQHDGAPAHFSARTRQFLNERFPDRWIGGGGPVAWPPRSPDLNPLDYCLWDLIKEFVYEDPPNTLEALENQVSILPEDDSYESRCFGMAIVFTVSVYGHLSATSGARQPTILPSIVLLEACP
ncbi:uncharacterized protein LOC124187828 [Neodiprion fabricii]|uniref:uncharacterized protein LOC124187828 n=1 Tax=Neodiprion fabricii TaxID=2872261 RepID=UPI001ED92C2E|nr:uncharacterized protein LOC124187828 [Neodiprion fabricii]